MNDDKPELKTRRVKFMGPRPVPKSEPKSRLAARALTNAAVERRLAQHGGQDTAAQLVDAERLENFAAALMKPAGPPTVRSGEVVYASGGSGPPREFADTLSNPDQAAIEASVARTDLLMAAKADIVAMGVDAAVSAKADNSFEKMLSHQLALIHALAMRTGARALDFEKRHGVDGDGFNQADSLELSRLSQAASRLCSSFQTGVLTLQRLRNGSSQTMTIRHVTVEAGGQAVIGNVKGGGHAPAARRGGRKNER